ncbi:peptidylprolyl isomerase [Rubinisphaera margarita]|uniref:peptidylprolyl isomerase n=1 Tax=Rubinisphaera margarita TaxID=2909586 RepID=UPI001EE844B8|nr:peptidylprolyl isomerase [Rubinisphaera margarita]MCG6157834.1 peptidylprolyl isomerase [Rubinisphaera margarita]
MRRSSLTLFLFSLAVLSAGCRFKPDESPAPSPTIPADPETTTTTIESDEPVATTGTYQVKFETSKGNFVVEVHPEWAPNGAARFKELVKSGFYDETRFFRNVPGFMVQWGISGDPAVAKKWQNANIPDDPPVKSNEPGMITFAMRGPNTRTTQVFINFGHNSFLNDQGFAPFGQVIEGMDVVKDLNAEYGESPDQGQIVARGNEYLNENFPRLDYIKKATIISDTPADSAEAADEPEMTSTPAPETTSTPTPSPATTSTPAPATTATPTPATTSTPAPATTSEPTPTGTSEVPPETIEPIQ